VICLAQMQAQQVGGPDGLVITEVTWVSVNELLNDWLDGTSDDCRAARAFGIGKSGRQIEVSSLLEAGNPVVNSSPRDTQPASDVADGVTRAKPEESLCAAQERCIVSGLNQITKGSQVVVRNANLSHHIDCAIGILYFVKELLS
jgi:hypothetical protein